jgi:hypothetical protein
LDAYRGVGSIFEIKKAMSADWRDILKRHEGENGGWKGV